jgi:2-C-methyl-D-erythritol 2,4-cyclodiphosphate synthase
MSRSAAPRIAAAPRIGLGCDRHPFAAGRRLVLGGVRIPAARGLAGHSDADVLAHAVCDALLGALGMPDMGLRFPATDRRHRGRASLEFVNDAMRDVGRRGYTVGNLDAVLLAETPALADRLPAMRRNLAKALGCPPAAVSLKAKRGEGLGWIGRSEGIAAQAVVLLLPAPAAARPRRPGVTRPRRRG